MNWKYYKYIIMIVTNRKDFFVNDETHAKVVSVDWKIKNTYAFVFQRHTISSQIVVYVFPISINFFHLIYL